MRKIKKLEQKRIQVKSVNKYLLFLFSSIVFFSCRKESEQSEFQINKALLSSISIPKGYSLISKNNYFPEAHRGGDNDSLYVLKKGTSTIGLTIEYFLKNKKKQTIENRISFFVKELSFENSSFKISNKKVNNKKSIWYINYTIGTEDDLLYNFYMERYTSSYRIIIKTYNNQLSLEEINYFYNEILKFN